MTAWFTFGYPYHGLTLGTATAVLVAQMMAGETTLVDPAFYRAEPFRGTVWIQNQPFGFAPVPVVY